MTKREIIIAKIDKFLEMALEDDEPYNCSLAVDFKHAIEMRDVLLSCIEKPNTFITYIEASELNIGQ